MEQKKYIYIALSNSGSIISKLIRLFAKGEFAHASLSLDKDLSTMYSFSRKYLYFPFIGGFMLEKKNKGMFARYKNTKCQILEIPVTQNQYNIISDNIKTFIINKDKYKYNLRGLILASINVESHRKYYFYCSEFIKEVLLKAGIDVSSLPGICKPCDFLSLPNNRIIYSGLLNTYKKDAAY